MERTQKSFDHQAAFRQAIAVGNDGSSGLPRANDNRKRADGGNVRLIEPVTASSRRNRVATINSLSKLDSPSPTVSGKTDARGRAVPNKAKDEAVAVWEVHTSQEIREEKTQPQPPGPFAPGTHETGRISRARKSRWFAARPGTRPSDTDSSLE